MKKKVTILILGAIVASIASISYGKAFYNPDDLGQFKSTKQCKNCNLTGIIIRYANYNNSVLTHALLTQVGFEYTAFANSDFSYANMVQSDIRKNVFSGSNFTGANLQYANCSGSNFSRVDFTNAKVSNADFSYTNLIQAKITKEQLATVKSLQGAIMPDGTPHNDDADE